LYASLIIESLAHASLKNPKENKIPCNGPKFICEIIFLYR